MSKSNFFNLTKPKGQKDINVLDEADRGNPTIDNSGLTLDEIDLPSDYPLDGSPIAHISCNHLPDLEQIPRNNSCVLLHSILGVI